jgi:hypothetical protein
MVDNARPSPYFPAYLLNKPDFAQQFFRTVVTYLSSVPKVIDLGSQALLRAPKGTDACLMKIRIPAGMANKPRWRPGLQARN